MSARGSEERKPPKRIIGFNLDDNLEIRNGVSGLRTYETAAVSWLIGFERMRKVSFRQVLRVVCGGCRDADS
ncbi:MAG: hypothetical protein WBF43_00645, partial [Methylocella sp.]